MLPKHYIRGLFAQGNCQQPETKLCQGKTTLKKAFIGNAYNINDAKYHCKLKVVFAKSIFLAYGTFWGGKDNSLVDNINLCREKLQIIGQPLHFFSTSTVLLWL